MSDFEGKLIKNGRTYTKVIKGSITSQIKGNFKNKIKVSFDLGLDKNSWNTYSENSNVMGIEFLNNTIISTWNGGSSIGIMYETVIPIDLTKIKSIKLKYNSIKHYGDNFPFWLAVNKDPLRKLVDFKSYNPTKKISDINIGETEQILDVSDLIGEYFIEIAPIGCTATITDLILE